MPPREAKSRLLTREYVADLDFMTTLTAPEREWYLLTALWADDAGYLDWNVETNAGDLYRFEGRRVRERKVRAYAAKLAESRRFVDLGCGHAVMPRVGKRPRSGGREWGVMVAHKACPTEPPDPVLWPAASAPGVVSGAPEPTYVLSGPVLSGPDPSVAGARAQEPRRPRNGGEPTTFQQRVPRPPRP